MATYRYPLRKLDDSDDYLEIKILEYKAPGITAGTGTGDLASLIQRTSSDSLAGSTPIGYIFLPIPQSIEDTNAVDWGDDSLNSMAAYALGASKEVIEGENFAGGAIDQIIKAAGVAQNVSVGGNGQNLASSYFSAAAANVLGANTSLEGVLSRASGKVLNPNMELLFKGVKLRSFNFAYDLVARDKNESNEIKGIITTLKKAMAPRKSAGSGGSGGGGLFVSAPNVFQLTYKKGAGKHPFLHTFKPTALLNMSVDYTASGTYATYSDATPVHIKISMSFQELNPVYYEDYTNTLEGVGY
jgi:hypothetical protein